jgi:hypothetical protein
VELSGSGLLVGGGASDAIGLNTQVVLVHVHVEEAPVAPVGAPRVAADPVLLTLFGLTVTDNSDGVVELRGANILLVDVGAIVSIERVSCLDSAREGTVLKLGLHLVDAVQAVVFADVVAGVRDGLAVLDARLAGGRGGASAVTADVDVAADALKVVLSNIRHAARVDQTLIVGVLEDLNGVASVTRAACLAVDDRLGIDGNWGLRLQAVENVEAIGEGG